MEIINDIDIENIIDFIVEGFGRYFLYTINNTIVRREKKISKILFSFIQ